MPVTDYYTVNGELLGEKTSGGPRTDYLSDALGSVVATVNPSAQVLNTYRYKPYGAQLAKTGVGADPAFRWVGGLGYRQTGKAWSDVYVRARHYDTSSGRWTTRDPRWPREPGYAMAGCDPVGLTDASGMGGPTGCHPLTGDPVPRVPTADPAYACYRAACAGYLRWRKYLDWVDQKACDSILDCAHTNTCLGACDPGSMFYSRCHRSGGDPHAPGTSYCCVECLIRLCCAVTEPNDVRLRQWLRWAFERCRRSGGHPRPPIGPFQPDIPDCLFGRVGFSR